MAEEEKKEEICNVCNEHFPFDKLYQYQNKYIEHKDPSIQGVSQVIEATGDIFRSMCNTILVDEMYIGEKLHRLESIARWNLEDEREKCRSGTEEKMKAMKEYMEKVKVLEEVVKKFPVCNMENRRKVQLMSLQLIKDFANWGMDRLPIEVIKQVVEKYVNNVKSSLKDLEIHHFTMSTDGIVFEKEIKGKQGETMKQTLSFTEDEYECVLEELASKMKKSINFVKKAIASGEVDIQKLSEVGEKCTNKKLSFFEKRKGKKTK